MDFVPLLLISVTAGICTFGILKAASFDSGRLHCDSSSCKCNECYGSPCDCETCECEICPCEDDCNCK